MVLVTVRGICVYLVIKQAWRWDGKLLGMLQMLIELCIYMMNTQSYIEWPIVEISIMDRSRDRGLPHNVYGHRSRYYYSLKLVLSPS